MEVKLLILAVFIIVIVAGKPEPSTRPGKCPSPKQIFNCERLKKCKDDYDCLRFEKCCKSSCGPVCTDVRQKKQSAIEKAVRKGCPTPLWYGTCARQCVRDKDCECSEKCCFNGCGYQCVMKGDEVCKYGQHPKATCTDVSQNECPKGYSCTLQTNMYEATGVCCKNPPIKPDCSLVRCAYPTCKGAYKDEEECCLQCPDCKMVVCPLLSCKNKYVPPGQCCPVCGPDCSLILCPKPLCKNPVVPMGQCCAQCKDCRKPVCPAVTCNNPVLPSDECCPICEQDCSKVLCPLIACPNAYKPPGECCLKCPDCRDVACPAIFCENRIFLPGDCCGICAPDCQNIPCPEPPVCVDTFIPKGECCPVCKPDCSAVLCLNPECPGSFVPEGQCCPRCPGICRYKGKTYDVGESFPDDCNTCTCLADGEVACTEMFCAPCEYNGVMYDSGTTFKDKCLTCTCSSGKVDCDESNCTKYCENGLKPIPKPKYCGGIAGFPCPKGYICDTSNVPPEVSDGFGICCKEFTCPNGRDPFSKSYCGKGLECPKGFTCEFPKYEKSLYGYCCIDCRTVKCGRPACKNPILLETECCARCPDHCELNGVIYQSGTSFMDRCNKCTCTNGLALCTKKGCVGCETGIPQLENQICKLQKYEKYGPKCPKGYDCKFPPFIKPSPNLSGFCCRKPVCPVKGQEPLAFTYCNNILKCPKGYVCSGQEGGEQFGFCCPDHCEVNGVIYPSGATFMNRCNKCTCSNGLAVCTKIGCLGCETGIPALENQMCVEGPYKGPRCPKGYDCKFPIFPVPSKKGFCCRKPVCPKEGQVALTFTYCNNQLECPKGYECAEQEGPEQFGFCCPAKGTCVVGDKVYLPGERFDIECNGCTCSENGVPICTEIACESGCYENGKFRRDGDIVENDDPCLDCKCVEKEGLFEVICTRKMCPKLPCDQPILDLGKCCRRCPGTCVVKDKVYQPGESYWKDCNKCTCTGNGISVCTLVGCAPGCYEEGKFLGAEGTIIENDDPCIDCECVEIDGCFEVDCVRKVCPKLPCSKPIFEKGKCCGKCPDDKPCYYDGISYESGESFFIECNQCRCFNGVPGCTRKACRSDGCYLNGTFYEEGEVVGGPKRCGKCSCVKQVIKKGDVKYEVKCPKCCIEKGNFYQIGNTVPRNNPCEFCKCFGGPEYPKVICAQVDCAPNICKRPIYIEGECCPVCEVPGCLDENDGSIYDLGEEVPTENPCEFCFCEKGSVIACNLIECPAPPCENYVRDPNQCCPFCKPGCISEDRIQYDFGEVVPDNDPCVECRCELDGSIQCIAMSCLPPEECKTKLITPPGKCCPICRD